MTALGSLIAGRSVGARHAAEAEFHRQAALAAQGAARIRAHFIVYSQSRVAAGLPFSATLQKSGIEPNDVAEIVSSAQPVFDLRHVRAGHRLDIGRSVEGDLREIRYQIDADSMLDVKPGNDGFKSEIQSIPAHTKIVTVRGEIRDSLFNAVADAGETPELAMRMAQIFGWDLDFYTDPRAGDTFRIAVEKKEYLDGRTAGYGRILAAEYDNDGHAYQAVLFHDPSGRPAYYSADGKSLQKAFLRSPLKFAAPITSHFSLHRFHPILKMYRPHLGIDYGAPTGTPVQTIGAGRVVFAGRKGGDGNMVHIVHANGYETMYLHLSRILVHFGQRVEQGQRIGLVGMTGLATGPHLDFRIIQHGVFRNFLALQLPPAEPVARRAWDEFAAARDQWMPLLSDSRTLDARTAQAQPPAAPPSASTPPNQ